VILFPAIDISEGQAVRLVQGDFDDKTVYRDSPLEAARGWVEAGARFLHVVDLDGARTGSPKSLEHLERITHELSVPVQYGGGLRSLPAVRDALRAGAERVILGTAAYNDIDFLDDVLGAFRERVIVSVDTRGGNISTSGWQQTTQMPADSVIERLQNRGVRSFVYTNVDKDGMLEGPDPEEVRRIASVVRGRFLYSGGIGTLEHLQTLRDLRQVNLGGVIVGKALYEGRFTVREAQHALAQRGAALAGEGGGAHAHRADELGGRAERVGDHAAAGEGDRRSRHAVDLAHEDRAAQGRLRVQGGEAAQVGGILGDGHPGLV
jgi:phosphoribosylformimino-5-aminoimidazole carboxamide ribotide isomerase